MLFNSFHFLVFFVLVLCLHNLPISWTFRKTNLLVLSYLFYAAWSPPFVVLIWFSTLVDWYASKGICRSSNPLIRKSFLALSCLANLGLLGFFKYGQFLTDNFISFVGTAGITFQPVELNIILPVGISFYTFKTLSYTCDIYLRKEKPCHSFLDYALYVTFFPQLVAGPIVRSGYFLPQCEKAHHATWAQLSWGLSLLTLGLFEKIVVADYLMAPVADKVYALQTTPTFLEAWVGTLAFSIQIFCDFAGYSTCALGIALCLGFVLPKNFNFPYAAIGLSDFWNRWHISLSSWLRDYLYIPLGGNRLGPFRTRMNLMVTMLLGGLWHGASWTFMFWGGLHGLYLWIEHRIRSIAQGKRKPNLSITSRVFLAILTYCVVCLTWVFFRAQNFKQAFFIAGSMLGLNTLSFRIDLLQTTSCVHVVITTILVLGLHFIMRERNLEETVARIPKWVTVIALYMMVLTILGVPNDERAFIYFQF